MKRVQTLESLHGDSNWTYSSYSRYHGSSFLTNKYKTDEYLWYIYNLKKAATDKTLTDPYLGLQTFESTENRMPRFNACTNHKIRYFNYPHLRMYYRKGSSSRSYIEPYYRFGTNYGNINELPTSFPWFECSGARSRAWNSMQPRFEGEISMLNFLFELKDFKVIMKHALRFDYRNLSNGFRRLKSFLHRWRRAIIKDLTWTPGDPIPLDTFNLSTKALASMWLTKNFMVDPTVADCLMIHKQLQELVSEKQKEFFDRGQEPQKSHYSEIVYTEDSAVKQTGSTNYYQTIGVTRNVKFTATLEYMYNYSMRGDLSSMIHYWGLAPNAEALWNMIPLSFVVDYFIKVGDSFKYMRRDPNVELMDIQYCESQLDICRSCISFNNDSDGIGYILDGTLYRPSDIDDPLPVAGYESTSYKRIITLPNKGLALPRVTLPSKKQAWNMVALLRCFL